MVGQRLEEIFTGRFGVLAFRRPRHRRALQGKVSGSNIAFALRYALESAVRLLFLRPRVVYIDVPKDRLSFIRTSPVLLTALVLRIRVIGDLAGADFQFLGSRSVIERYARWILRRLYRIRVLGPSVASTMHGHGLTNTVVVSNGIPEPPGAGERHAPDDVVRLLYVGKIAEAKGIFTLLEGVRHWNLARRVVLHVVGEWESEETRTKVMEIVQASELTDRIHFHGLLVNEAKWGAFRAAHILVHPTYWDGQPVTMLEALAFGLPIVATPVGAIPDTFRSGEEGYLMRENTAAELIAGVQEILRDTPTYESYSRRARRAYTERYTLDRFADNMDRLLQSALLGEDEIAETSNTPTA
jgi:glycosyltransferase involved in cell wall biosynthesis